MATQEELRVKEQLWQQEILIWKNKYQSLEEKVSKKIEEVSQPEVSQPEVSQTEVSQPENTMNELIVIRNEIVSAGNGVTEMEKKISDWFQVLSDKIEEDRQQSRKNNLLLHGMRRIPNNLTDSEFIVYIAQQINYLFPSLGGTIYPSHIDDAHILNTKRKRSTNVVIIKFVNRWIKDLILKCRDDLSSSGLNVTEHLTENSLEMLASAKKIVGEENVRVIKTIVFARHNGTKHRIKTHRDIDSLKKYVEENPVVASTNLPVNTDHSNYNISNNQNPHGHEHHTIFSSPYRGRPRGAPSYNGRGRGGYFRGNYRNDNFQHHCY